MLTVSEVLEPLQIYWKALGNNNGTGCELKAMVEAVNEERADESLSLVATKVPFPLRGRRLLEIGCGVGAAQLAARKHGINAFGVEPLLSGIQVGRHLVARCGAAADSIVCAVGEHLPFPEASFDVVCSFQVLEHVLQPDAVLDETIRVLKPGGYFVHVFPNYGSLWEGHYGIVWLPHMPKALARFYVAALGCDRAVLEKLQLLTHERLVRMLRRHPNVRITDWGFDLWETRLRTLQFSEWAYLGRLKELVRWLHRLRLVSIMLAVGKHLHLETPIVLVGTKLTDENHQSSSRQSDSPFTRNCPCCFSSHAAEDENAPALQA